MLLDEHQRWKVMTWLVNLHPASCQTWECLKGSLVSMGGQVGSCKMGSLVSFIKSRRFNEAMYGRFCVPSILVEC
jgi:hypothetical protein